MTPNVKKIDAIIEAIKAEKIAEFDMQVILQKDHCGTSGCIAGFYNLLERNPFQRAFNIIPRKQRCLRQDSPKVQEDFGMTEQELNELFYSAKSTIALHMITKDMAIAALEDVKKGEFESWKDYR